LGYFLSCPVWIYSESSEIFYQRIDMKKLLQLVLNRQIWRDRRGQDLIEYALMAGFVAVAAGAIMPGVSSSINIVFSKVNSVMIKAASS